MVNLATLNFLEEDYRQALTGFEKAYAILSESGGSEGRNAAKILINISRAHYKLEQFDQSRTFFAQASSIDPELSGRFAYLETASAGIGRASEKSDSPLFIGEDE
jgi:tetratricopeptide (TPR) repeat protein